jgi:hypothetical protein
MVELAGRARTKKKRRSTDLAAMSPSEGQADEITGKRTSTALTAGVRSIADVAGGQLGWPGVAQAVTLRCRIAAAPGEITGLLFRRGIDVFELAGVAPLAGYTGS